MKTTILSRIRQQMKKEKINYYIVYSTDPHSSEYVCEHYKVTEAASGFTGDNAILLIGEDKAWLWTDGRYFIQAEAELSEGITLMKQGMEGVLKLQELMEEIIHKGDKVGVYGICASYDRVKALKELCSEKKAELIDIDLIKESWLMRPQLPKGEIRVLPLNLAGKSVESKLKKTRKLMKEKKADGYLITALDEIMWLYNIRGCDIACNPVAISYAFVTAKQAYLFLQEEVITEDIELYAEASCIKLLPYEEVLKELSALIGKKDSILVDSEAISYSLYEAVSHKTKSLIEGTSLIKPLKAKKNKTEISNIKNAFIWDSAAVIKFLHYMATEGSCGKVTEAEAAKVLEEFRQECEIYIGPSFDTISAYGANAAMAHYAFDEKSSAVIEKRGFYLCDSGGQYEGGTTDVTRTIAMGELTDEEKTAFTCVAAGWIRLMNAVWPEGCSGRNLDILSRQRLWEKGLDFNHGTGHGVGYMLSVHEGPQAIRWRPTDSSRDAVLESGMLITDEPGMYAEGKYGIRTENTLLVVKGEKTEYGQFLKFEPLTLVPIDRRALNVKLLTDEERQLINSYHNMVYEVMFEYVPHEVRQWLWDACAPI